MYTRHWNSHHYFAINLLTLKDGRVYTSNAFPVSMMNINGAILSRIVGRVYTSYALKGLKQNEENNYLGIVKNSRVIDQAVFIDLTSKIRGSDLTSGPKKAKLPKNLKFSVFTTQIHSSK